MPTVASSLRRSGRPLCFFSRRAAGLKRKREKKPLLPGSSSPKDDHSYVQLTFGGGVRGSPLRAAAAFARLRHQTSVSAFMVSNELSCLQINVRAFARLRHRTSASAFMMSTTSVHVCRPTSQCHDLPLSRIKRWVNEKTAFMVSNEVFMSADRLRSVTTCHFQASSAG